MKDQAATILKAARRAAYTQRLQPADAEAFEIDFELHMRSPEHWEQWAQSDFSSAWVVSCATNFAINWRRAMDAVREREVGGEVGQAASESHASESPDPSHQSQTGELRRELDAAMATLSDTERAMLIMRCAGESTYPEIANAFKTAPGAARKTVNRALKVVRSKLDRSEFDVNEALRLLSPPATQ